MRKWMRERLQRRKKKPAEEASQPAAPPLQPAYFDAEPIPAASANKEDEAESSAAEPEPASVERSAAEAPARESRPRAQIPSGQRGGRRRRRGRGGRSRGGEGGEVSPRREKAVAEAFAPAAVKGLPVRAEREAAAPEDAPPAAAVEAPAAPVVPAAAPRPPKGVVVLAIGLPGSGKSSWFKRHNVAPLSSDTLRALLFDDVREQRYQDLVFSNLRSMLKARLIARRPMNYVDATNLTPQERHHWIRLARDYNYEVHAVFFDVPLEVCIERHQRRDRVVPEDVMRRMAAKMKPPAFEEGFAKITVVRVKKKGDEPAA